MAEHRGGQEASKPKKPNLFLRILTFLLTAALVLGAVALVVNWDSLNLDALKRRFAYRDLERTDSGQAGPFRLDSDLSACFADLGGDLLAASTNGIKLYSSSGSLYVNTTLPLELPVVEAVGKVGLVYDVGGRSLRTYSGHAETFALDLEEGRSLLSARLNTNGWLAITTQESGHKGAVTVYDSSCQAVMQVSLSSRFIMDAVVSPDNGTLAMLTIGVDDREFESRIDFYRLNRPEEGAEPNFSCSIGNNAILDLRWDSNGIWLLGDTGVSLVKADGTLAGTYSCIGRFLKGYSLDGNGTAALLLGRYRAGSSAELVTIDTTGAARATLPMEEQVLDLSAAGHYIAVLTADRLDLYDQDLQLYSSLSGTHGARQVLQRADGSAMLLSDGSAQLYIPH